MTSTTTADMQDLAAVVKPCGVAWYYSDRAGAWRAHGPTRSAVGGDAFRLMLMGASLDYLTREHAAQLGWAADEGKWDLATLEYGHETTRWTVERSKCPLQTFVTLILGRRPNDDDHDERSWTDNSGRRDKSLWG